MKHFSSASIFFLLVFALVQNGAFLVSAQNVYNACHNNLRNDVAAVALPDKVCQNECTDLAVNSCIADVMTDDFENGMNNSLWSGNTSGQRGSVCGTSGGNNSLLMDGAGLRIAETQTLNTSCASKISFSLTYGTSAIPGNCEDADLPTENVKLEYFSPVTGVWTTIKEFDNGGETPSTGPYDSWASECLTLPAGARAPGVRFRWVQPNNSGAGYDSWAIDDVVIEHSPPVTYVWEPGFLLGDTVQVCPSQTTTYTVTASGGAYSGTATVTVTVVPPVVPGTISTPQNLYCKGDAATLTLAGYQNTEEVRFEYSQDGITWFTVPNCDRIPAPPGGGAVNCSFPDVDDTFYFRARQYNSPCPSVVTDTIQIDFVEPLRMGGGGEYCEDEIPNPLTLFYPDQLEFDTLPNNDVDVKEGIENTCVVQQWEVRDCDAAGPWSVINNTTQTYQPPLPPFENTCYRAKMQCGPCDYYTNETIVHVDTLHIYEDTVTTDRPGVQDCSPTTGRLLLPKRSDAEVVHWEYSNSPNCDTDPDNANWTIIDQQIAELVHDGPFTGETHRCYRARLLHENYACEEGYAHPVRIDFTPCVTQPPDVTIPDDYFCCGNTVSLTPDTIPPGFFVERWESSTDGGNTWTRHQNSSVDTFVHQPACDAVTNYRVWLSIMSNPFYGIYSDTNRVEVSPGLVDVNAWNTLHFYTFQNVYTYCKDECATLYINDFSNQTDFPTDSARIEIYDDANFEWVDYNTFHIPFDTNAISGVVTAPNDFSFQICNLDTSMSLRAFVKNDCEEMYRGFLVLTVQPPPDPGVLSRDHSVCVGDSSEVIELIDYDGSVVHWERDAGCVGAWSVIPNITTPTFKQSNVDKDYCYRVLVHNNTACDSVYSNEIKVSPVFFQPSAGFLSADQTICLGDPPDTLRLQLNTGPVQNWQYSYNAPQGPWFEIQDTNSYYFDANMNQSTCFRAVAGFGRCNDTSNTVCIDVEMKTIAGRILGFNGACRDSCLDLELTESNGTVETWQYRDNCTGPWIDVPNNTTINYSHCAPSWADSACVRLILRRNLCPRDTTDVFKFNIFNAAGGGDLTPQNLSVCLGGDAGTLRLQNYTGQIVRWEASFDCQNFSNPLTVLQADQDSLVVGNNINMTTCYRVVLQNGNCPPSYSDTLRVQVDPPTVAGTVTADQTVCPGDVITALNLSGHTGDVVEWQRSTDCPGFATRTPINNQTTTLNPAGPLTQTTCYRALVQNGACPQEASAPATITLGATTLPGTLAGTDTLCGPGAPAGFALSGHTGAILRWESAPSDAPFAPVNSISHTLATYQPGTISSTTCFRAVLGDAVCGEVFSNPVCAVIEPQTVPGAATADKPFVCSGDVGGDVILTGRVGDVLRWESSEDNFNTINLISETGDTLSVGSITVKTCFRAIVAQGRCDTLASAEACIDVTQAPPSGSVSQDQTICEGATAPQLNLSGTAGQVLKWQSSVSGAFDDAQDIANTNTFLTADNMTTQSYRAVLQGTGGACPEVFSAPATVTVVAQTVGGTLAGTVDSLCPGAIAGELTLTGELGDVQTWTRTTNNWLTSDPISNTTNTYTIADPVNQRTCYRATVKNDVCPEAFSDEYCIEVYPPHNPGGTGGVRVVCISGNQESVTLETFEGDIVGWESSTDEFNSITSIASTANPLIYNDITQRTCFRALTSENGCDPLPSDTMCVNVDEVSIAGVVADDRTVCAGSNTGAMTLLNRRGFILGWEEGEQCANYTTMPNTQNFASVTFQDLTVETCFRAIVQNGVCPADTSAPGRVDIIQPQQTQAQVDRDTVCIGGDVTVSISPGTVTVQRWESSTDNFATTQPVIGAGPSVNVTDLQQNTCFRAIVANGFCAPDTSAPACVVALPGVNGGAVTAGQTICEGDVPAPLSLSGNGAAPILRWESSTDNFQSTNPINHTSATFAPGALTQDVCFRAVVQGNALCGAEVPSQPACIQVDPATQPGVVSQARTVCYDTPGGQLELAGETGTLVRWESSTDGFANATTLPQSTKTINLPSLTEETCYIAVVKSGVCPERETQPICIDVLPETVAGMLTGDNTICTNDAGGLLELQGNSAPVVRWERAPDASFTAGVAPINETGTTYQTPVLTASACFRAVVQQGNCPPVMTNPVCVTVIDSAEGGVVTNDATVCIGNHNLTLNLQGENGTILRWEKSEDGFNTDIQPLTETSGQLNVVDLTTPACYRAVVSNDYCGAVNSDPACVTLIPESVGGAASSDQTVCEGNNQVTLTLSGETGNVVRWESSADGFNSDIRAINTPQKTLVQNDLTEELCFRAVVKNGSCDEAFSSPACIALDEPTVAGVLAPDTTVCKGLHNFTIELTGRVGVVQEWYISEDNFASDIRALGNTADAWQAINLQTASAYRVVVKSGVCPAETTAVASVDLYEPSVGGSVGSPATVCEGLNNGLLNLTGRRGDVLFWESSTDNFQNATTLANTSDQQDYTNLGDATCYRAVVQNGTCPPERSAQVCIDLYERSEPGALAGAATVCRGANSGQLQLSGQRGDVVRWESSTDDFASVLPLNNTTAAQSYTDLDQRTCYRAVVQNGTCPEVATTPACIDLDEPSEGGAVSDDATVCQGQNNGTLALNGQRGAIIRWESSTDDFQNVAVISQTSSSFTYNNLVESTCYRAVVKNGACDEVASAPACVTVDLPSVAGTANGGTTVCEGDNNIAVNANGFRGDVLRWERRLNGGSWTAVPNSANPIFAMADITQTQCYRVAVKNGVCPEALSPETCFNVDAPTEGGLVAGGRPVCLAGNSGSLQLTNFVGQIQRWEKAEGGDCESNFVPVETINSTSTSISYANLTVKTCYRAAVKSGVCAEAYSSIAVIAPGQPELSLVAQDILCNGNRGEGEISVTVSGGVPYQTGAPYFYEWRKGGNYYDNSRDLVGLDLGTYCLTATDSIGCVATECATIGQPPALGARVDSIKSVTCLDAADGFIRISVWGGTQPYSYRWENNGALASTDEDAENIRSGFYSVTITDANGCTYEMGTFEVLEATKLYAILSYSRPPKCFGGTDGALGIDVRGGIAPYTYVWNNGRITEDMFNLGAGTYTVTATDAAGCGGVFTYNVLQPPPIEIVVNATNNISCHGGSDGSIGVDVSGGTPQYRYYWANDARQNFNTEDVEGVPAGRYSLYVTDQNGCRGQTSLILTEPSPLRAQVFTEPDDDCANTARVEASGGVPPYTYLWTNGATTPEVSGLMEGAHTVSVRDANDCLINETVVIPPKPFEVIVNTHQHVSCHGGADGALGVTVVGGNEYYSYRWIGPGGAEVSEMQDISNLSAGDYYFEITDRNNCTFTQRYEITEPSAPLNATVVAAEPVSCHDATDGRVALQLTGGVAPYAVNWEGGFAGRTLEDLAPGTYTADVRDANGCLTTVSAVVEQPAPITLMPTNIQPASCAGAADGAAAFDIHGGTPPYAYAWSNGAETENLSGVPAGTYGLTVTDVNGCEGETLIEIGGQAPLEIELSEVVPVSCEEGAAAVSVSGGAEPYAYQWSDGSRNARMTIDAAGEFGVTVTDANGCAATRSVTIGEAAPFELVPLLERAPTCAGHDNGMLYMIARGGAAPYRYVAYKNNVYIGGSSFLFNLEAGQYRIVATDATGCRAVYETTFVAPPVLDIDLQRRNPSCADARDGEITATVNGGVPPYVYQWSNGHNKPALRNLPGGVYTLTVRDANGCHATASTFLSAGSPMFLRLTASEHVDCGTEAEGLLRVEANGGAAPYAYQWNNGPNTAENAGLTPGTYSVTATDVNGCSAELNGLRVEGGELPEITVSYQTPEVCAGSADGSLGLDVSGGVEPFVYQWAHGATTEDLSGLSAGTYTHTLTDANGCEVVRSFEIDGPGAPLELNPQIVHVSCANSSDGMINLEPTGGRQPYQFIWTNGAQTSAIGNLQPGVYTVIVRDALGCVKQQAYRINAPAQLSLSALEISAASCGANGSATITANGGAPPYTFNWGGETTGASVSGLAAGVYTVIATDANGCTSSLRVTIPQGEGLVVEMEAQQNVSCPGGSDGVLLVRASGGSPPYSYVWPGNREGAMATGLTAGSYTVLVMDDAGCQTAATFEVEEPANPPRLTLSGFGPTCPTCANGMIFTSPSGGAQPYTYSLNGGPEQPLPYFLNLTAGAYTVRMTDVNGCSVLATTQLESRARMGAEEATATEWRAYPNPSAGDFAVQFEAAKAQTVSATLFDLKGAEVWSGDFAAQPGNNVWRPDLPELAAGAYALRVRADGATKMMKIIIE